jgi:legumain
MIFLVYAVTAANATESSYACYFDQKIGTFLGDTFSVNWMENTDGVSYVHSEIGKTYISN